MSPFLSVISRTRLRKIRSLIQLRPGEPPEEPEGCAEPVAAAAFLYGCTRRFTSAGRHLGLGKGFADVPGKCTAVSSAFECLSSGGVWELKRPRSSPARESALFRGNNGLVSGSRSPEWDASQFLEEPRARGAGALACSRPGDRNGWVSSAAAPETSPATPAHGVVRESGPWLLGRTHLRFCLLVRGARQPESRLREQRAGTIWTRTRRG